MSQLELPSTAKQYAVYGQILQTREDLAHLLESKIGSADLFYEVRLKGRLEPWEQTDTVYRSPYLELDGTPRSVIQRRSTLYRIHIASVAQYDLAPTSIICYPYPSTPKKTLAAHLLKSLLPLWLEQRGIATLHASAIEVNGRGVAFISHSGNGKSVLAATFMQDEYPLLTDDVLAIEQRDSTLIGYPGYPEMRLWPVEAEHFLGYYETLEQVLPTVSKRHVPIGTGGFGCFSEIPCPLACLYLLERRTVAKGGQIDIIPLSRRISMIEMMRRSFIAPVAEAMGLAHSRLDLFANIARQIPVRQLVYPDGLEYLPALREAILKDIRSLHLPASTG